MKDTFSDLKISIDHAQSLVSERYHIKGTATPLPGDVDFNFRIKTDEQDGYILKVSRPEENLDELNYQIDLLNYLKEKKSSLVVPEIIKDKDGNSFSQFKDENGNLRNLRLLSWISGRVWSSVNPQLDNLRFDLGRVCGQITKALVDFDHPQAHRTFKWDIAHSDWTRDQLHLFNSEEKELVSYFQNEFDSNKESYSKLRKSIVHHDANDNNIVVSKDLINPKVVGIIDYGDAMYTQIINDVAIACAYAIMRHNDPLEAALPIVSGYHSIFPLLESELAHLYHAIGMRLVISVTSSRISEIEEPENSYKQISVKTAWDLLDKWQSVSSEFANYCFRNACGFPAHPDEHLFAQWAKNHPFKVSELFPGLQTEAIHHLDLSAGSSWIGSVEEFNDLDLFQFKIDRLQKQHSSKLIAGGYLEPRVLYTSSAYEKVGNSGNECRSVHLGIDFWKPAHTAVHALFDGEVVTAVNDAGDKEYGGLIILKHQEKELTFYSLYGHLTVESALSKNKGDVLKKGDKIGELGNYPENGNWAPHLHFQLMLSMMDYEIDFPGVCYVNQIDIWKSICPDPNLLFNSKALQIKKEVSNEALTDFRLKHLGKSLRLHYKNPLKIVRGSGVYLIDQLGRKYLDTVNNVAHVGHEHPSVVKAGQEQMAILNTNSRYLHEHINALSQELHETLPPELCVYHFVNSGSEANELAVRMAKAFTGARDIIASEAGYHGNTNMCVDISSYKFDGKGGKGAPEYTQIFPLPDAYRGTYRGDGSGEKYADEVQNCIERIQNKGRNVAAFIVEPIISCGGQVELPPGFLKKAYMYIRKTGAVCISDEVQTGCGRMGKTFWGFQLHDVVPDIVTIGKPFGNGHPVAAVACTREVADSFANGMEYFNTFGGNPVSCRIALEVLRVIKDEQLQVNALKVGAYLKEELKKLSGEYPIIGDVRGQGLFLGIELVDSELNPLGDHATYLINRMKAHGILMSSDGPDHNVIKIKPPMVFNKNHAIDLVDVLKLVLSEDFMKNPS